MSQDRVPKQETVREEAESAVPPVTKSQVQGSVVGAIGAGAIGALIGWALGVLLFDGRGVVIAVISFAVAGLVFGGVAGGITLRWGRKQRGRPDV